MPHYVYVLRCSNGSLYTGYTTNLEERVSKHNKGKGAKYTRSHRPVELAYHETFRKKSLALKREIEIKKLKRGEKLELVLGKVRQ